MGMSSFTDTWKTTRILDSQECLITPIKLLLYIRQRWDTLYSCLKYQNLQLNVWPDALEHRVSDNMLGQLQRWLESVERLELSPKTS